MGITDILQNANSAEPIAEMNGVKIASFEDAVALSTMDLANKTELNPVQMNPDGSIAATPVKYAAVNPEMFFDNRYRVIETEEGVEYQVVAGFKDYLTIKGQSSGRIPQKQVMVDVIYNKNGKPKYKTTVTVSDTEFVSDFTNRFSREDMAKIMPELMRGPEEPTMEKSIFK